MACPKRPLTGAGAKRGMTAAPRSGAPARNMRFCIGSAARGLVSAALLGAALAPNWPAGPVAAAQEQTFRLAGQVVDAETGRPLVAAVVKFPELVRYAFAGVDGRFAFDDFPAGTWEVIVEQLGYHTSESQVALSDGAGLHVRLRPDPIALEGLTVRSRSSRLLSERRRRVPLRIVTIGSRDFAEAVDPNPAAVLKRLGRAPLVECSYEAPGGALSHDLCVLRGGRRTELSVFLDESPMHGGTAALSAMHPETIHSMDFILRRQSGELRVYTKWFVERLDKTGLGLAPIVWEPIGP